ncbi:MAG: hypothetical protein ABSA23_11370 [Anaerolineales bacterium]
MSNQTITRDLRGPCGKAFEKVSTREAQPASRPNGIADCTEEKELSEKRTSLFEILFNRPWELTSRGHAGEELRPTVVYMPGGSYTVTDSHRNLAAACHAGPVSTLAEVWHNTLR